MYIRNGQNILKSNIPNVPNISPRDTGNIPDISEITPPKKTEYPEPPPFTGNNTADIPEPTDSNDGDTWESHRVLPLRRGKKRAKTRQKKDVKGNNKADVKLNRFTEYLYNRKYFILLFSVIYIAGLIVGAILIKNVDGQGMSALRNAVDNYFADVQFVDMLPRIINNVAVSGVILLSVYISGITVFAPFVCAVLCLYKGLSCGYIIGIYISGGADLFHIAVCCLTFVLYLLTMLFFILACSESMGFSVFLLKSRESLKNSLSLRNIGIYSVRYAVLSVLAILFSIIQSVVLPIVYSAYY